MAKINYESYEGYGNRSVHIESPSISEITEFSISYDGGRIYLYINGEDVYTNLGAGNDFSIKFTKD